jgi:hypothetical protein
MRFRAAALVGGLVLAGGCGEGESGPTGEDAPPGSLNALWDRPGPNIALVPGTSTFVPGEVRFSFLVVRNDGSLVERPSARVWLARDLKARPFVRATATLEEIDAPGGIYADAGDHPARLYVTRVQVPAAGTYWLLAEPVGARIQGVATLDVKATSAPPEVGERAIASETPTLASSGGDLAALSTSSKPVPALYRHSIASALAEGAPFVVTFSTPKFCTSRTCGPVVDVVDAVRREFARRGLRFIHVEVYEGNDPAQGYNRWMREWKLTTEPWVFLVGRDGRIAERFEGSVSVRELRAAVGRLAR